MKLETKIFGIPFILYLLVFSVVAPILIFNTLFHLVEIKYLERTYEQAFLANRKAFDVRVITVTPSPTATTKPRFISPSFDESTPSSEIQLNK